MSLGFFHEHREVDHGEKHPWGGYAGADEKGGVERRFGHDCVGEQLDERVRFLEIHNRRIAHSAAAETTYTMTMNAMA